VGARRRAASSGRVVGARRRAGELPQTQRTRSRGRREPRRHEGHQDQRKKSFFASRRSPSASCPSCLRGTNTGGLREAKRSSALRSLRLVCREWSLDDGFVVYARFRCSRPFIASGSQRPSQSQGRCTFLFSDKPEQLSEPEARIRKTGLCGEPFFGEQHHVHRNRRLEAATRHPRPPFG